LGSATVQICHPVFRRSSFPWRSKYLKLVFQDSERQR
jgi:hypothetical protein